MSFIMCFYIFLFVSLLHKTHYNFEILNVTVKLVRYGRSGVYKSHKKQWHEITFECYVKCSNKETESQVMTRSGKETMLDKRDLFTLCWGPSQRTWDCSFPPGLGNVNPQSIFCKEREGIHHYFPVYTICCVPYSTVLTLSTWSGSGGLGLITGKTNILFNSEGTQLYDWWVSFLRGAVKSRRKILDITVIVSHLWFV